MLSDLISISSQRSTQQSVSHKINILAVIDHLKNQYVSVGDTIYVVADKPTAFLDGGLTLKAVLKWWPQAVRSAHSSVDWQPGLEADPRK